MEKFEIILVRFDGKNYTSWAFQFQVYLEGKELQGYIYGSETKPNEDENKILAWKTKDAKIKITEPNEDENKILAWKTKDAKIEITGLC